MSARGRLELTMARERSLSRSRNVKQSLASTLAGLAFSGPNRLFLSIIMVIPPMMAVG